MLKWIWLGGGQIIGVNKYMRFKVVTMKTASGEVTLRWLLHYHVLQKADATILRKQKKAEAESYVPPKWR
jgi:hypothetical protein